MPEVSCPCTTCTCNVDKKCIADEIYLKFRAAVDLPGKGTVVMMDCLQMELPQDREKKD